MSSSDLGAVDDRLEGRADGEVVRLGEVPVDGNLVAAPAARQPPLAQEERIDRDVAALGDRDCQTRGRLAQAGDVEDDGAGDARLDRGHAVDRGDRAHERVGRAGRRGEDVAEAVALVIGRARLVERLVGADGQNQRGDAAGHDQGDRQRLRPQAAKVADQLAVERAHRRFTTPARWPPAGAGWHPRRRSGRR